MKARPTQQQRLRARAEELVAGERFIGAFQVGLGPRPGSEGCLGPIFGPIVVLVWRARRTFFTVIVTDQAVHLWRNGKPLEPFARIAHLAGHEAPGMLQGTMEYDIDVAGTKYWMYMIWSDEVRKIQRVLGRT